MTTNHTKLSGLIRQGLGLHKSRADTFAACALTAIGEKSVKHSTITARLPSAATLEESKQNRIQDFFRETNIDYDAHARFLFGMIRDTAKPDSVVLALDRTDWESRGNVVNLLVLSVCLGDTAQPIVWNDLRTKGNSNTQQRKSIVSRFIKNFGRGRIDALVADREFVGEDWFSWLQEQTIPYAIRLKENFKTRPIHDSRQKDAKSFFNGLRPGESLDLGMCDVCGVKMGVVGMRLKKDTELLIIGYSRMGSTKAQNVFLKRWNIETGFQKLKSHGFDMESSRLRGEGKYNRLMAVLALGFAWCYAIGHWSVGAVRPIRFIKKLNRLSTSVFRRGMDLLRGWLNGNGTYADVVSSRSFETLHNAFIFVPT